MKRNWFLFIVIFILMFGLITALTAKLKRQYVQRNKIPPPYRKKLSLKKKQVYKLPSTVAPWNNILYSLSLQKQQQQQQQQQQ